MTNNPPIGLIQQGLFNKKMYLSLFPQISYNFFQRNGERRFLSDHINKRGYNKFLSTKGEMKASIDYDKLESESKWDGLKGCLTNTDMPAS